MKVYDIWINDEDDWTTDYGDSLEEAVEYLEREYPGSDWIIIENELPF